MFTCISRVRGSELRPWARWHQGLGASGRGLAPGSQKLCITGYLVLLGGFECCCLDDSGCVVY